MLNAEKLKDFDRQRFSPGFVSIKRNGIHGIYDPKNKFIYSRTPNVIHGLDHIVKELEIIPYPVVGEIVVPGIPFEEASGKIRSYSQTPEALFHIFNVITPQPFHDRWDHFYMAFNHKLFEAENIVLEPHFKIETLAEYDQFHEDAVDKGAEGTCWIHPQHIYQPGKRTWQWMKRVPFKAIEAKIIGFETGTSGKKYDGSLGAMICETLDVVKKVFKVGIFKGQTDAWRQKIWDEQDAYLGEIITVEFKNLSKYDIPTQPRFKGFRWDL